MIYGGRWKSLSNSYTNFKHWPTRHSSRGFRTRRWFWLGCAWYKSISFYLIINVQDARRQGASWSGRVLKPSGSSDLVTNGNFGSGITGWTQGTATQAHDTTNNRIKLTSGGTAQTPRSYQSLGTLTASKTYRIKARGKHKTTGEALDNPGFIVKSGGCMKHGGRKNKNGQQTAEDIGYSDLWE